MSTPTLEQQISSSYRYPNAYPDPTSQARASTIPHDREGQNMGVNKIRMAFFREYQQVTFDSNASNAAITLTGDDVVGGNVRFTNAGVGAVVVNLPTAVGLAAAAAPFCSISPGGPTVPQLTAAPSNNRPGSWKREIHLVVENASGQALTITPSATITADTVSGSNTIANGARATLIIRNSVDTPGSLAYTYIRV